MLQSALNLSDADMRARFGRTLSFALGTYEMSPLENCLVHSVIVNGGRPLEAYGIIAVKDYSGNIIWDNHAEVAKRVDSLRSRGRVIFDPVAGAVTVSMLQGVCRPGGTAWGAVAGRNLPFAMAGKTGTSADYVDAWFVGYTSRTVTAVWIGNKTGAVSLGEGRSGGVVAAPVWAQYLENAYAGVDDLPGDFTVPQEGLSRETICLDSGEVAGRQGQCPRNARQLYYSGTEPGRYCPLHAGVSGEGSSAEDSRHDH
jgi:penicillin-binding protein 1A